MTGYDVIGDVHGHAERLVALLRTLGYRHHDGAWRHSTRTAVFVGDLIDRGVRQQAETIHLVRSMVDAGAARIVLGNHEFNAVAFATVDPARADHCRAHNDKHRHQHAEFLHEFEFDSAAHRDVVDWFRTIPLWLDLDELRVVHACWSAADIEHLRGHVTEAHALTDHVVIEGTTKGTATHTAVEHLLKGPEIHLGGIHYRDKDGHRREAARVRWWDAAATTLRRAVTLPSGTQLHDAADQPVDALPDRPVGDDIPRYTGPVPVLFGHYWFTGEPAVLAPHAACVDYSAGKGGPLVAYRWHEGDIRLEDANFVVC
jgi:hypothetical protein